MPLEKDGAQGAIDAAVNEVKSSIDLDDSNQAPEYSGNESAPDSGGPDDAAALPSGSPGTTGGSDGGPDESFGPNDQDY